MEKFLNFMESINEWTGKIFSWVVAVLTIVVVLEVVLRYCFNSPTVCNFEITKQLYGFYFMIVSGYALLHGSHVSVDIVSKCFSKRNGEILDLISYVVFFFPFCIVMIIYGTYFAVDSWRILETSWSACSCALYPIKTVVAVSFLLMTIQGVANFTRTLHHLLKGEKNA